MSDVSGQVYRVYSAMVVKTHRGFVVFGLLVAAALQFLVVKAATSLDLGSLIPTVLTQLPERFRLIVNETLIARMGLEGAVAFGFNHPIMMVIIAINSVAVPTRHISGDIEDGSMEIAMSHPVGRTHLVLALWSTGALLNLAIVGGALAGSLAGLTVYKEATPALVWRVLKIASNLWVLSVLIGTAALLASTLAAKGRRPSIWVAVTVLAFYVLNFLRALWDDLSFTVPLNIFSYYQPQKLMFDEASWGRDVGVLAAIALGCLAVSIAGFRRRDIPG
jgi:ABC-type transport system involved in multi-copper enzyme maturation permease subunit